MGICCKLHPLAGVVVSPGVVKCAECGKRIWTLKQGKDGAIDIVPDRVESEISRVEGELRRELEGLVGKEELAEFQKFAFKDRMMEMAIAFMLGASFKAVVGSIVDNLLMPLVNYFVNFTGTGWREYKLEPVSGMVFEVGKFAGSFLDFLLMALILYILYVKIIKRVVKSTD